MSDKVCSRYVNTKEKLKCQVYTDSKKYSTSYYISPIEIGLLLAKIKHLKSPLKALSFDLQIDMK